MSFPPFHIDRTMIWVSMSAILNIICDYFFNDFYISLEINLRSVLLFVLYFIFYFSIEMPSQVAQANLELIM